MHLNLHTKDQICMKWLKIQEFLGIYNFRLGIKNIWQWRSEVQEIKTITRQQHPNLKRFRTGHFNMKAKEKETASYFTIFASRILASNKSWLNKNHFPCIKKKVGAFSAKQNGGGLLECCYEQCFRRVLIEERREGSPCSPAVGVVGAESRVQTGGPSWGSRDPGRKKKIWI